MVRREYQWKYGGEYEVVEHRYFSLLAAEAYVNGTTASLDTMLKEIVWAIPLVEPGLDLPLVFFDSIPFCCIPIHALFPHITPKCTSQNWRLA